MVPVTPYDELLARYRDDVCSALRTASFAVPAGIQEDTLKVAIAYFRVLHRSLPVRPRTVDWSNELRQKVLPPPVAAAVRDIEIEATSGKDLNPRLTRKFFKSGFNDDLLNDLNVQHFHLGPPRAGKKGQVGGTRDLLFSFVRGDALYFVDVLNHDAFKNADFLGVVKGNWPALLKRSVMPGICGNSGSDPTPEERAAARKAGITVIASLDGKAMLPPGGGVATDGTSIAVVDRAASFLRKLRHDYSWIEENSEGLAGTVESSWGIVLSKLDIRVHYDGDTILFVDEKTGIRFEPALGVISAPIDQEKSEVRRPAT